jgi:hypothetical protein
MTHERRGKSDEWYTPRVIFDALGETFDLDVAHPRDHSFTHVPAHHFFYEEGENRDWGESFVWMNQPFGNGDRAKLIWMEKFLSHRNGIALTPDRTSARWFRECWGKADLCLFTKKIDFIRKDGSVGTEPGNGTVLWACGARAIAALERAAIPLQGFLALPYVAKQEQG